MLKYQKGYIFDGHTFVVNKEDVHNAPEDLFVEATALLPDGWISVEERLPEPSECWERYNVSVLRSHFPTSSYDTCDSPYDEKIVTTAAYDSTQKIWHLDWGEQLNGLIDIEDAPLNGDFITHWQPLPPPPGEEDA